VQGVTDTEVMIGSLQDLSGPLTSWGVPVRNGLQMAIDEANAEGGVHGRTIRLVVEDSAYDPKKAVLAAQKLVTQERVFATVGTLGTPVVQATMPRILERGVLHLFPLTGAKETYEPLHPLKFASNTPYSDIIQVGLARMLDDKQVTRVGILYQDDDFGLTVFEGAQALLKARGLAPVSVTTYKRGATDFSAQIARMRADGAELVVLGTVVRETIGAMQAARALGWDVTFFASHAAYTGEVPKNGGAAVEGLYAMGQIPFPYADDSNPAVRAWVERYQRKFGVAANVQAVFGYVSGSLFLAGLEAAGRDLTAEGYAGALVAMGPWVDATLGGSPIDFSATNHLGIRSGFLAEVQNGRWVQLTETLPIPAGR